jgi:acid phosphatase (class A)
MMRRSARLLVAITGGMAVATGAYWWQQHDEGPHFIAPDQSAFVGHFAAPPARDSPATRAELDELLAVQTARTEAQVRAARADRKTDVSRFYPALGLDAASPPHLPQVERLAERVEDDVRIAVRAAKEHFRRLRPFEVDPRIDNCIGDVKADLSYPSGHAAYAWAMAGMLSDLLPERRAELEARAEEFARQRMICGVHFPSDLVAGRQAAELVLRSIRSHRDYAAEAAKASAQLREALRQAPQQR